MDFLLGHVKHNVYTTEPATVNELRAPIERERADIPVKLIRNVLYSISRYCQLFMEYNGHQFEHFRQLAGFYIY